MDRFLRICFRFSLFAWGSSVRFSAVSCGLSVLSVGACTGSASAGRASSAAVSDLFAVSLLLFTALLRVDGRLLFDFFLSLRLRASSLSLPLLLLLLLLLPLPLLLLPLDDVEDARERRFLQQR